MVSISMYGPDVTTVQDMSLSPTTDGCALSQSATRPLPL